MTFNVPRIEADSAALLANFVSFTTGRSTFAPPVTTTSHGPLQEKIKEAVKECVPTRKTTTSHPIGKPLWMNEIALRKVRRKHSAWIRYVNTLTVLHT